VLLCDTQSLRVAVAVGGHARLDDHYSAAHLNDGERVRVTVRINTNDEVQFICKHPERPPAQVGGQLRCRSGDEGR
jgi:hypothetical protein